MGTVTVVNKRTFSGQNAIYIGRGSIFGNPFRIEMGRAKCIEEYRNKVFIPNMSDKSSPYYKAVMEMHRRMQRGEHLFLACYCAPLACHGDIIKEYLDSLQ